MKFQRSTFVYQSEIEFKSKYMLGGTIGSGYFSEVRDCKDLHTSSLKAVKIFTKRVMDEYQNARL